jgi:hypothetical protein
MFLRESPVETARAILARGFRFDGGFRRSLS